MKQVTPQQLGDWLSAGEEAARRAAEKLEEWRSRFSVKEKARADLVTDADFAAQIAIRTYLHSVVPGHDLLGEEDTPGTVKGRLDANSAPTWIVDPLDGTANYVHDVPFYSVSIGLMVAGELVVGVVYDPRLNEMFSAAKGMGVKLNGKPMSVSSITSLGHGLLATGFPPDPQAQERNLIAWKKLSSKAQAIRRTGSTALNLAYIACGRFDGYWAYDNHVWDVAGGIVLVREGGGIVTRADGSKLDPFLPDMLASNGKIHDEILLELES